MNITLFHEIQHHMQEKNWNKTDLAKNSGIHISEISRIFNHKQPFSLQNLDMITEAFGLAEGTLYSYYVEECFNENQHLDKRRSVQFLYKCTADGYEKQSYDILNAMLEEKAKTVRNKNLTYIFTVAEDLLKEGKEKQALPLYEMIIENMSNRFSEQLAVSYFRRFYILRLTEKGQHALAYVLENLAYMPTEFRIEAYLWITAFYYRREQWEEVLYYAERLECMVNGDEYYARALMYKSLALRRVGGTLEEVLALTDRYAQINGFFADIAVGNRFVALLDFGQLDYVDEYLAWIENRDDIYMGLPRLLEAYVDLHRLEDAKRLLDRFQHAIDKMAEGKDPLQQQMHLHFRYAYSLYQCKSCHFPEGLNEILDVAYAANKIKNVERFKRCLRVYWEYRNHATFDNEEKYIQLLTARECN